LRETVRRGREGGEDIFFKKGKKIFGDGEKNM
jgi:hypothetical protein